MSERFFFRKKKYCAVLANKNSTLMSIATCHDGNFFKKALFRECIHFVAYVFQFQVRQCVTVFFYAIRSYEEFRKYGIPEDGNLL